MLASFGAGLFSWCFFFGFGYLARKWTRHHWAEIVSDGWWHLRREPPFSDKRFFLQQHAGRIRGDGTGLALLAYCVMYGA
jgi:hypothetical protein